MMPASSWDLTEWRGNCIVTRHTDPEDIHGRATTLTVDRADPRILISTELLDEISRGDLEPDGVMTIDDDVVTIRAANRTVVYRLRRDVPTPSDLVAAEWPD
jgi:hypothetical protein